MGDQGDRSHLPPLAVCMDPQELFRTIEDAVQRKATRLDLSHNKLTSLPPEIARLTHLTKLELRDNQLTRLPPEIGKLTRLSTLDLAFNRLTSLPPDIGNLTKLSTLSLTFNALTSLPPEIGNLTRLENLNLFSNQLKSLPREIRHLTRLKLLDLRENPLPLPPELLGKDQSSLGEPAAILNYYFSLRQTQASEKFTGRGSIAIADLPLNEAKVLLVGQGSVGKTSLVRRLIDNQFDANERKTEGIHIRNWQVTVNDQTLRLNLWDFGGQEIMHATHQFFLTRRSLYLLVLDARLGENENRVDYWLKLIRSFGEDSPVILVGNKVDQQPLDLDRRGLQTKYPSIQAIVETSCETGQGIAELVDRISRGVLTLEHIHDPLPPTWFNLKRRLETLDRDYLPYSEYEQLCREEGISDSRSQRTLIGFLHDLGTVLNFRDDPRLAETPVLAPQWVTHGVYRILNDNALLTEHQGILEQSHLDRILDLDRYPRSKHLFLLDMMRKFELCFDLEGFRDQRFLIPDLLPKEEPYTGDWSNALGLQYHYALLPSSVISRFIVRMNDKIHQKTCWRSGVVLAYEANIALVKADRDDRKIFIWVKGPESTRRAFLTVIRAQFDAIHRTIPGIQPEEKVALPNHPGLVVGYQHLLNLERMGDMSFIPEGLTERVSVKALLDGITTEQERRELSASDRMEEQRSTRQRSIFEQFPNFEQQRWEKKQNRLQAEWNVRNEKLTELRQELVIQTDRSVKFQLEKQIQNEQARLTQLEAELDELEQFLNTGSD